jgi:cation diffusion facilitator family transporter
MPALFVIRCLSLLFRLAQIDIGGRFVELSASHLNLPTQESVLQDSERIKIGKRWAIVSVAGSGTLSVANVVVGLLAGSTSVFAAGLEFAGDVLASSLVWLGMVVASKAADEEHPYGHGRFEILMAFSVGMILFAGGIGICYHSLQNMGESHPPPSLYAVVPLFVAILIKSLLSGFKFHFGRMISSAALVADAWNDGVDILSALAALTALGLTLYNPTDYLSADHYGGLIVGIVVIITGLRIVRDASLELMDTMPNEEMMGELRQVAHEVPRVLGVEKCYARKTGMHYHVDIHLEVDPSMTVRDSHDIATQARFLIRERLSWVADVLVHIEPAASPAHPEKRAM